MPESLQTRLARWRFNLFPAYWGTGGRIRYISSDWREVHVELPLTWRTRNYVGTLFGGSIYGAVDPLYMVMFIKILGPGYVVWDKAAAIRFLRPGRDTLCARFAVDDDHIDALREELERSPSAERVYRVELTDRDGVVHASVEKTLYFRKKERRLARRGGEREWRRGDGGRCVLCLFGRGGGEAGWLGRALVWSRSPLPRVPCLATRRPTTRRWRVLDVSGFRVAGASASCPDSVAGASRRGDRGYDSSR